MLCSAGVDLSDSVNIDRQQNLLTYRDDTVNSALPECNTCEDDDDGPYPPVGLESDRSQLQKGGIPEQNSPVQVSESQGGSHPVQDSTPGQHDVDVSTVRIYACDSVLYFTLENLSASRCCWRLWTSARQPSTHAHPCA